MCWDQSFASGHTNTHSCTPERHVLYNWSAAWRTYDSETTAVQIFFCPLLGWLDGTSDKFLCHLQHLSILFSTVSGQQVHLCAANVFLPHAFHLLLLAFLLTIKKSWMILKRHVWAMNTSHINVNLRSMDSHYSYPVKVVFLHTASAAASQYEGCHIIRSCIPPYLTTSFTIKICRVHIKLTHLHWS